MGQTDQISMKCGLKESGESGFHSAHRDMKQLHDIGVPIPFHSRELFMVSRATDLKYLMLLNMKCNGTIKGQGFNGVRTQQSHNNNKDIRSPKVAIYWIMLSCVIDAQ